jgi:hypothetical protein
MITLTFPAAAQYVAYELARALLVLLQVLVDCAADIEEDIFTRWKV